MFEIRIFNTAFKLSIYKLSFKRSYSLNRVSKECTPNQNNLASVENVPILNKLWHHARDRHHHHAFVYMTYESNRRISNAYSYGRLWKNMLQIQTHLLSLKTNLKGERIAILCPNGYEYVVSQFAIWSIGGIAVPLCPKESQSEMKYKVEDTKAIGVLIHKPLKKWWLENIALNIPLLEIEENRLSKESEPLSNVTWCSVDPSNSKALIVYTSGTTGKPKGVVSTHKNLEHQITGMVKAWGWKTTDRILHVLPLHHVHGIVNVLNTPLWVGATCEMMPHFDAGHVWRRWMEKEHNLTLFMAVPTIYSKLIHYYFSYIDNKKEASESCKQFRLMVSGSASLPTTTLNTWKDVSGHLLLERYGMTEIGMGLTQPLDPTDRIMGTVGSPFPGVEIKIVDEETQSIIFEEDKPGELLIRGPSVFKEYFGNVKATKEAFSRDGWFLTGDIACYKGKVKSVQILGRKSTDIIKSGGYKISALEIERTLLDHEDILECSVVGIPDEEWGEVIGVVIKQKPHSPPLTISKLKLWCQTRMAKYKIPRRLIVINGEDQEVPRNIMGKVLKKKLVEWFHPLSESKVSGPSVQD